MQYDFNVINDKLVCTKRDTPLTGNVNTYRCVFQIESDIEDLYWFCVFEREGNAYVQPILDGECFIPREVLIREGGIKIGCYGTNLKQGDYKRVSTNWVYFNSLEGAYTDAAVPDVPEPDFWEELVSKSVPMIGENGNWFIYDMSQGKYVDTGVNPQGEALADLEVLVRMFIGCPLRWDGNYEGREIAYCDTDTNEEGIVTEVRLVHVSNEVPPLDFAGVSVIAGFTGSMVTDGCSFELGELVDAGNGILTIDGLSIKDRFFIVPNDNMTLELDGRSVTFTKRGVYATTVHINFGGYIGVANVGHLSVLYVPNLSFSDNDGVGREVSNVPSAEVFNDYANNTTNIPYAHVEGRNNKANVKTFLIDDGAENYLTGNSITLKSVDGIAVGMPWNIFTVENGTQWKYQGFVTDVKGNTVYTEDKKLPTKVTPAKSGSFLNTFIVSGGSIGNVEITDYTGDFSVHVEGRNNVAVLDAHAEGTETKALGYSSHAEGRKTIASGECSHSEGYGGIASGDCSHIEGAAENASGHYSHAEGYHTNATAIGSHAEGNMSEATAKYAHAEGSETHATGVYSHAEGEKTRAKGYAAHTEGHETEAWEMCAHSEGYYSRAEEKYSHAEGKHTRAVGECSHSEGSYTWAMSKNQHVEGRYNLTDNKETYAHIVGNGDDTQRSNAHTLDWSGNAWYAGYVEATSIILKSPNGTRFKITVNDNGALSTAKV